MKLVITGGTGFLGRHLVWRAAAEGAEVVFTGRNPEAAANVIGRAPAPVRWQALSHGDAAAESALANAARGADAIVHCAALSSPWGRYDDFHRANVVSTAEVVAACEAHGVPRLVHVSTPSIYFGFADRIGIREDAELPSPANDYVRTKLAAEALVQEAGLRAVAILRPRALFGPWDQTLMPRILRVLHKGALPIMRGGHIQLDLTYIDNAVDAAWLALTKPLPRQVNIYNVSNGEPRELSDLLSVMAREFALPLRTRKLPWPVVDALARGMESAARIFGRGEPVLTRYSAAVLAFSQTLDVSALRNELGWRPRISIDEGIGRHARWWLEQQA
ncbi:NAD(P)-dependent oxidoreductase [Cupriavidus sp. BIS7]|uniref:NAD-dependent epimerase/dehydratase family protein n=1 Tax=Cupriavidus sp. BIS7 TaxID=1217718 RepID=UPI0002F934C7|nr:NAD(P)-dependent oxidoreductase [Cupriavidus sp. BIS7]